MINIELIITIVCAVLLIALVRIIEGYSKRREAEFRQKALQEYLTRHGMTNKDSDEREP
ncbi:hypothetical protein SEA_FORZA_22 [Gordonia phage Forza]|uniref:Uncharacterized protein n=1 Tax=Gordonia phage Forza TaxID=2571247 RepID=A0A650EZB7_9CAUD|nr:hypothetical protein PP303_gp022 [Gordonia phage Forza]QEM41491.1 hypothetical protein SEA_BOOPY_22 [Gordonia phage Boopy]QGT55015.1 hypothetical protein SEA_FORZA_22 [Gordonia phage Forza]UXE04164.1 hypothetical protein SEA_BLUENGOLD_20 [Gordonia phage BlueNGold]WBF03803.1 hypothetical protein SEA_MAREELIH_20 [Gordonia phage Mareelih]